MINELSHLKERFGEKFESIRCEILDRWEDPYNAGHSSRFAATICFLDEIIRPGFKVLELGFSDILHRFVNVDVSRWDFTGYQREGTPQRTETQLRIGTNNVLKNCSRININFEESAFPVPDEEYDLILCCEVIEHMDVDPMHLMSELNRICNPGGNVFLTTPNSTSARIVYKVVHGYQPCFFMKYGRDRSPYRHNFEYAPNQLIDLCRASGFECRKIEAIDTFEDPLIEGYQILRTLDAKSELRGDNLFAHAIKTGGVIDRYPPTIYV